MWSAMLFRATIRVNPRQVAPALLPASAEDQHTNSTNQPRTEVAPASLPASDEEEFANFTNDLGPTNPSRLISAPSASLR